jgi:hypothetical protein
MLNLLLHKFLPDISGEIGVTRFFELRYLPNRKTLDKVTFEFFSFILKYND